MLSEWLSFAIGVLSFWRQAAIEAASKAWIFLGQTREGVIFASLVLVVSFLYLLLHHGRKGIWSKFWEKALEALVISVVAAVLLFLWELFCEPWAQVSWATSQMEKARTAERSANLRKDGDSAIIAQQKSEIETLRLQRPPAGRVRISSDADILCQKLENCPSPELRKRALNLANELDDLYQQYYKETRREVDAEHQAPHQAIIRAQAWAMSSRYRSDFEPDVIKYRKVIIDRLPPGSADHSEDWLYENNAPGWISLNMIEHVNNIATSLRHLASLLPEH